MVLAGAGSQLYDISSQYRFQTQYTGRVGVLFNHPPFETLFYLPSALLSYERAYLLWTIISTLILALCAILLNREAHIIGDSGLLIMLFFVFAPVALNFLQGQDLCLLLLVYTLLYRGLRHDRMFEAGGVLALGLFKPHLVLPCFVILLVARRSWKFVLGFAAVGAILGGISLAISGWRALLAYPSFVISLSRVRLAGYAPASMANLRGLLSLALPESFALLVLVAGSIALLWIAIIGWKGSYSSAAQHFPDARFDLAFANTVIVALLVGYHLSPHDLTLLLLPIALLFLYLRRMPLRGSLLRIFCTALVVILFLPPLYVLALAQHAYAWLALPMIMLCAILWLEVRRSSAALAA
jgi:hypothetical protein